MFKKIRVVITGLALVGIISVGLNSSFSQQASHADLPTPQRPDLVYTHGDHFITKSTYANKGDTGGIVSNKSVRDPSGAGSISTEGEADLPTRQA